MLSLRSNRVGLTHGKGTVTDYTPDAVSRLGTLALTFLNSASNNLTLGFAKLIPSATATG